MVCTSTVVKGKLNEFIAVMYVTVVHAINGGGGYGHIPVVNSASYNINVTFLTSY